MTAGAMKAEDYSRRQQQVGGWSVVIETFKLGDRYHCTVSNADPGARIARADGPSRDAAEQQALEKAGRYLAQTRRFTTS
jgi:hypothetical protein